MSNGTSVRDKHLPKSGCVAFILWVALIDYVAGYFEWSQLVRFLVMVLPGVPIGIAGFLLVEWLKYCQSDQQADNLVPIVNYYRDLGFFAQYAGQTDKQVSEKLLSELNEEWGTTEIPEDQAEVYVLCFDENRVRWHDMDDETQRYKTMLTDWGEISRGVFQPSDIYETKSSGTRPVIVEFDFGGQRRSVKIDRSGEDPDMELLRYVNGLINHTRFRFYNLLAYPEMCIVLLTEDEARKIKNDRYWALEVR
ncbi:MAG: hypothetical protein ACYC27_03690 [Armatimonadota bacterium]